MTAMNLQFLLIWSMKYLCCCTLCNLHCRLHTSGWDTKCRNQKKTLKSVASVKQLSSTEQSGRSHGENVWEPCSWETVAQRAGDGLGQWASWLRLMTMIIIIITITINKQVKCYLNQWSSF